ncbi:MAG: hypothetical protein ACYS9X_05670 [Planctomycetota bacterium]|jgi:hypothetical protein
MRQFQGLTRAAFIVAALLFASLLASTAGAAEAEKSGDPKPKPEERKTEPERREADGPAKASAKRAAASSPTSFEFNGTPMKDAVSHMQTLTGLNIILHPDLAETNPAITLRVKDMRLGTALNWICKLAGARYVLMDEAIYIVPEEKLAARERTVVVDVRDLIAPVRDFRGPELTLGTDTEGQGMIGLVTPDDTFDSDPAGELTMLVERTLRGSGEDVSVEERNGRLFITIAGEK